MRTPTLTPALVNQVDIPNGPITTVNDQSPDSIPVFPSIPANQLLTNGSRQIWLGDVPMKFLEYLPVLRHAFSFRPIAVCPHSNILSFRLQSRCPFRYTHPTSPPQN